MLCSLVTEVETAGPSIETPGSLTCMRLSPHPLSPTLDSQTRVWSPAGSAEPGASEHWMFISPFQAQALDRTWGKEECLTAIHIPPPPHPQQLRLIRNPAPESQPHLGLRLSDEGSVQLTLDVCLPPPGPGTP